MAKKDQDPISLLLDDLEEKTGGVFIFLEHLEKKQKS